MIRCKIQLKDIGNTCPLCNEQALDSNFDDRRDGYYEDTYKCDNCGVMVTYITKDGDPRQYHEYRDGEIEVQFEWPFGHSNSEDDEIPEEIQHDGFFTTVDGNPVHIQGDPNMSDETMAALANVIRAAIKQVDSDNPPSEGK